MKDSNIPKVGDRIAVIHECWFDRPTKNRPATSHNAPVVVTAVVELTSNDPKWRIETTRCDGTAMHVYLDEQGRDRDEVRATHYREVQPVRIVGEAVSA
ncbi:hypothetical protein [Flexivirga sp.]|uniref:hypothetical protein n=1 Tax=Flexivirga sp. TaxID=1962927 RepID=UPI003F7D2381